MANLILTTKCQRKCPYCFAKDDRGTNLNFGMVNFKKAVKFIETGFRGVNLLGGEPTLHKHFIRILDYLINKDFLVQVFTNGMCSPETLHNIRDLLEKTALRKDQLSFALNINDYRYRSDSETESQKLFLKVLGKYTYLSFTIQDEDTNLIFLHDIIDRYGLQPTIRLGLALPIFNSNNKHLPIDSYGKAANNIIELSDNSPGTSIIFDCGFPLCMFSLNELGRLNQNKENNFDFSCGQPIDIYPDLSVINCYPLSKVYKTHINKFNTIEELRKDLEANLMTAHGIFGKKCTDCTFFGRVCFGGCKGFYKPIGGDI
jgi:radical SAM protein with 4Fe4S-binding SPASM domain